MELKKRSLVLIYVILTLENDVWGLASKEENATKNEHRDIFPIGSPQRCLQLMKNVLNFEVLPGLGWDNLRNQDIGEVLHMNYSLCKITNDGKYLIPDNVVAIPIKRSGIDIFAETFDSMDTYTAATSSSINVAASYDFPGIVSVHASFSDEYKETKKHQAESQASTVRVQARYIRYKINVQPDSLLHPSFSRRLYEIANSRQLHDRKMARYLSQLLIRDFGTHVLTTVVAGGALVKEDTIKYTFKGMDDYTKRKIRLTAGASFKTSFGNFGLNTEIGHSASTEDLNTYSNRTTHSRVTTYGGTFYRSDNDSAGTWESNLDTGLVAMDRDGKPLYEIITDHALPGIPKSTVREVQESVRDAVKLYYKFNTYQGCSDPMSMNFDLKVNFDDGSCDPLPDTAVFGGVFQTCQLMLSDNGNICSTGVIKNPLTGRTSCPAGYTAVQLFSWEEQNPRTDHVCKRFWFWKHCHDEVHVSSANFTAFWCSQSMKMEINQEYKFGGMFTSERPNPLTGDKNCLPGYEIIQLGDKISICVTDDDSTGPAPTVFGGFFSCKAGNPMSLYLNKEEMGNKTSDIANYIYNQGPTGWPKKCPRGFSQHIATVWDECEIEYCIKLLVVPGRNLVFPTLRIPPFMNHPHPAMPAQVVLLDNKGEDWANDQSAYMKMTNIVGQAQQIKDFNRAYQFINKILPNDPLASLTSDSSNGDDSGLSQGAVAAISSVVTAVVCIAFGTVVVWKCKRKGYQPIEDHDG